MKSSDYTNAITKILNGAFKRLKDQNKLLSLRALALKMKLSASYLSKILNGKKDVPLALVPLLQKHLVLDLLEVRELQGLILSREEEQKASVKTGVVSRKFEKLPQRDYRTYGKEDLFLLERWYYLPLLNLLTLKNQSSESRHLAQRLGIETSAVETALKHLHRQGYISVDPSGKIHRTEVRARFPSDRSHEAFRNYHKIMMKRATDILSQKTSKEDFDNRLVNGVSFTGSAHNIKKAQLLLNETIYKVAELMAEEEGEDVFHLGLQFFKVTK